MDGDRHGHTISHLVIWLDPTDSAIMVVALYKIHEILVVGVYKLEKRDILFLWIGCSGITIGVYNTPIWV